MFQRLTSLFFSDSSMPEGLEEPKPFVSEEEEEDGWLVIDLGGEKSKVSPWFHVAAEGSCLPSTGQALSGSSRPCLGAFLSLFKGGSCLATSSGGTLGWQVMLPPSS